MASTSFARKDITGFILLLACLLLAAYTLRSAGENGAQVASLETQSDPSIDNTRGSGSRGLFEWTQQLGYRPRVWRDDFLSLPSSAAVLFCIAPDESDKNLFMSPVDTSNPGGDQPPQNRLTAAEGAAVRRWVSQGHTFVLLASSLPSPIIGKKSVGANSNSSDDDDDEGDESSGSNSSDSFASEIGVQVENQIDFGGRMTGPGRTDYAPLQPSQWTAGVNAIRVHPGYQLQRRSNSGMVLFGGSLAIYPRKPSSAGTAAAPRFQPQPMVIVYSMGKGHVVAIADDVFACNANLARDDNAAFLNRILTLSAPVGSEILFDEFHRSIGRQSASLWSALAAPFQYVAIQLLLAVVVALVVLVPRLGRSEPRTRSIGRTSAEYVTSLAGLYRSAGATTAALDTVYRQFLRELCQRFGLPTDITLDRLAEAVARRGGVPVGELRKLLAGCERALESSPKVSERDLIVLVRSIERFRKELGIG